ncbi:hypothetical protein RJT34_27882 [Clitoria ternatea]|uniref:Uncharacterized protein n=1 Tax=Clitoria ternatea TaxID=43366 RepID=A0AAN9F8M9_CLITE
MEMFCLFLEWINIKTQSLRSFVQKVTFFSLLSLFSCLAARNSQNEPLLWVFLVCGISIELCVVTVKWVVFMFVFDFWDQLKIASFCVGLFSTFC